MHWQNINSFGESYHDHACSVDYEKDVLDFIQVNNYSSWANIKRWWCDLFLLSYYDRRSRCYYRSSHAMRMGRLKQHYYFKNTIHPFSKFRNFWDLLIFFTDLLGKIIFHHSTSVLYSELSWKFYSVGVLCEAVIISDLFFNMMTGWINKDDRTVNLGLKSCILRYCSTKLFLHFISSMPLQTILFIKYGKNINCAICKCNRFVFTLRLVHVLRLYRLYDASSFWKRERASFCAMYFFKFVRIAVLGIITMLIFIRMADTIFLLYGMHTGVLDPSSYAVIVIRAKYEDSGPQPQLKLFLMLEIARVFKSFLLFSFGLRIHHHSWDKLTSLCAYFLANLFYMWSLIECHGCLSRLKYPQEKVIINRYRIMNLLRWRQLSDKFSKKVLKYCNFNMTKLTIIERQNGCYHALPPSLKKEITVSCYAKYVARIPYFSEWPRNLIERIALLLVEEVYMADDIVVEASISSDGLIIVDVGVLAVLPSSDGNIIYLIDGDYFGEISLVATEKFETPSVIALTSSKILFLDKMAFRRLMRDYPKLFFDMKQSISYINN